MERRNRGLSLLNQTVAHCISPSNCDNTTSLNDINLQLHASSTVSNPYSFNITKDMVFGATCLAENTITITVGEDSNKTTNPDGNTATHYFYGYSSNVITGEPTQGSCYPSIYHGIKILNIYIQVTIVDTLQGPNVVSMLQMGFADHVKINNITIDNSTYSTSNMYHFDESEFGCVYMVSDQDIVGFDSLIDYFINNVGKQITITLE